MKCNVLTPIAVAAFALLSFQCARQSESNQQAAATKPETAPAAQPQPAPATPAQTAPQASQPPSAERSAAQPPPAQPPPAQPAPASQSAAASSPAPADSVAAVPPPAPKPEPPPPPKPKTATLAAGTTIAIRTIESLSTKTVQTGAPFTATLVEPLVAPDGWTIAKKGAAVQGRVADSDSGGRVKGVASISLQLTSLAAADGQKIPLVTAPNVTDAKSTKGRDVKRGAVTTGVGAAVGAIAGGGRGAAIGAGVGAGAGAATALATKGDPAVVPSESVLRFQLSAPVTVTQVMKPTPSKDVE